MTVFDVLNFNREILERLYKIGIRVNDVRYIDLYRDYSNMVYYGEKVSYIVAVLATKYDVSERKVYDLIRRFKSDCNLLAV